MESPVAFITRPSVTVQEGTAIVTVPFRADPELLERTNFFIRWGKYGTEIPWVDEEVAGEEIHSNGDSMHLIRKVLTPEQSGKFGLTVYAASTDQSVRYWQGRPGLDDVQFALSRTRRIIRPTALEYGQTAVDAVHRLRQTNGTDSFVEAVSDLIYNCQVHGIGKLLLKASEEDRGLRKSLPLYYRQLKAQLGQGESSDVHRKLEAAFGAIHSVGVGEIVFVTPEGHHASAGGLARVITGLGQALVKMGVSVTVITPLYEVAQGNRHAAAETLIAEGIAINGIRTPIRKVGQVKIPFGPTRYSGSGSIKRSPWTAASTVYEATQGLMRVLFLRHRHLANELYPKVYTDEALLRALFLSRGALEVMMDPVFQVLPHFIITNDWLAGLVPAFLEADPRYREAEVFKQAKTIHVIHNCGKAYQGRLFVNQYGEDLWPLLGLSDEHFFGVTDPGDRNFINLTAAAIYHVKSGIVAVSKPYAEQLMTAEGGDGLEHIFRLKENLIYGISNGIEMDDLRRTFWHFGEASRAQLSHNPESVDARRYDETSFLRYLPVLKEASKICLQRQLGLKENKDAVIFSFVGRIAEQKGVKLLVDPLPQQKVSVLDAMLKHYPLMQCIVAGPPSAEDPLVERFLKHLKMLETSYPGRVAVVPEFVSHQRALHLTQASDFLLMPSRYEPGGISQLEALAAGTLVIARNVGGLTATLTDYQEDPHDGNAFLFTEYDASHLCNTMVRAVEMIQSKRIRRKLLRRAVFAANDWTHRADKYVALFQYVSGVLRRNDLYPFLQPQCAMVETLRPQLGSLEEENV